MTDGSIRTAERSDVPEILALIHELAAYERSPDQVRTSPELLMAALFGRDSTPASARCHVIEHDLGSHGRLGGIALWYPTFSTWTGVSGIHLEDLYVRESLRGRGYGSGLLAALAHEVVHSGGARLEWSVLDWNESARGFYRSIGAVPMDEWTVHRLDGAALTDLAGRAAVSEA